MSSKTEVYNVDNYTDKELYDILDLTDPSDRVLEAKINSMIVKYETIGNDSGDELAKFFKDIYERFFEVEDDTDADEEQNETELQPSDFSKKEDTEKKDASESEGVVDYTLPLDYAKGSLNPILQQTTKRIVSVDSQYRDTKSSLSSDFTFNLSDPLKDVVNLKLYSIQIPFTWYTISANFGSNFFFLKGNAPGINNGNHDYKVQIPVGNYTAQELINAVSNSLDTVKADPLYGDTIFGSTAISYDYPSSKATITVDITKIYNENQYILSFESWTTPLGPKTLSIPSFLGFNQSSYNGYTLYSNKTILPLTADSTNISNYTLNDTNNRFTIIHYTNPNGDYISDSSGSTVLDTIVVTLSRLETGITYSRGDLLQEVNYQLKNHTQLSNTSQMIRVNIDSTQNVIGSGHSHYQMDVRLNRFSITQAENSKVLVMFPTDTIIWTGLSSAFVFDNSMNELSTIVSETTVAEEKKVILSSPYFKLVCTKSTPNFVDSLNDYTFTLVNSPDDGYLLSEYIDSINDALVATNNSTKDVTLNPTGDFRMTTTRARINNTTSLFELQIDLTKTFTENDYLLDVSGTSINEIMSFSDNNGDASEFNLSTNIINSTFPVQGGGYLVDASKPLLIIKPQTTTGNRNITNYVVLPKTNSGASITYTDIGVLETDINGQFSSFVDEDGFPVLQGTNISLVQVGNAINVVLTITVRKYLTQDDFQLEFYDPATSLAWSIDDTNNSWAFNLKLGQAVYDLSDPLYDIANVTYAMIQGIEGVERDTITLNGINNKIFLNPVTDAPGEGVFTSNYENSITIEVPIETYTRNQLIDKINELISTTTTSTGHSLANNTTFQVVQSGINNFTEIRLNLNKVYKSENYRVVFYDPASFVTFPSSKNSLTNTTWDSTLGWILGFRESTEYDLSMTNETTDSRSITGDNVVSVSIYNYFMIVLDDYNQNHLNDGVITTTQKEVTVALPGYATKSNIRADPRTGESITSTIKKNGQNMTQNEIYAAQEILNSQSTSVSTNALSIRSQYYSNGPFNKNVFALVPLKLGGLPNNSIFVEYGGTLQNQQRNYFGPVNINRMTVKLINDRGSLVDLNGANWSFSFICEQLYQQKKT